MHKKSRANLAEATKMVMVMMMTKKHILVQHQSLPSRAPSRGGWGCQMVERAVSIKGFKADLQHQGLPTLYQMLRHNNNSLYHYYEDTTIKLHKKHIIKDVCNTLYASLASLWEERLIHEQIKRHNSKQAKEDQSDAPSLEVVVVQQQQGCRTDF